MLSKQEIFDKVCKHLLEQGCKSMGNSQACLYRGSNGTQCAVGCLITDEAFKPELNSLPVHNSRVREMLCQSGIDGHDAELVHLLRELQSIHDEDEVEDWAENLEQFAIDNGLDFNHLEINYASQT